MTRRFIQLVVTQSEKLQDELYGLADDGTVWRLDECDAATRRDKWRQLRSVPQPDELHALPATVVDGEGGE